MILEDRRHVGTPDFSLQKTEKLRALTTTPTRTLTFEMSSVSLSVLSSQPSERCWAGLGSAQTVRLHLVQEEESTSPWIRT